MNKISIIVPVYNEIKYIKEVLSRLDQTNIQNLEKEIIIVDDGSTDGTRDFLQTVEDKYKVIYHQNNLGKGGALKTGFKNVTGEIITIQDADLEYHPRELEKLVAPILKGVANVVYGSRMKGNNDTGYKRYYLGNWVISKTASILYGTKLTDIETCYKVFKKEVLQNINIESNDFGIEAEFTAKILKNKVRIAEIPIHYEPRSFLEGKKIGWKDGVQALWILFRWRFK
ncbi:glycosyltransferase family 2 protein [Patescibacteria group bacterium]|nr:glycosyltransferase family 2 protein [Patescibacteria group bacterium]